MFFVRPVHSEPGMESYCWPGSDQLSWWAYGIKIRCDRVVDYEDPHYVRMCFKSVKTQLRMYNSSGFILYINASNNSDMIDWIRG